MRTSYHFDTTLSSGRKNDEAQSKPTDSLKSGLRITLRCQVTAFHFRLRNEPALRSRRLCTTRLALLRLVDLFYMPATPKSDIRPSCLGIATNHYSHSYRLMWPPSVWLDSELHERGQRSMPRLWKRNLKCKVKLLNSMVTSQMRLRTCIGATHVEAEERVHVARLVRVSPIIRPSCRQGSVRINELSGKSDYSVTSCLPVLWTVV